MNVGKVQDIQTKLSTALEGSHKLNWWREIHVKDVMTSPVLCIDSQSSVTDAHLLMKEKGIRRLPVIDDGKLVGIISLGDVRGAMPSEVTTLNRAEQEYLIKQVKVERVMSRNVIAVPAMTSLADTARLLIKHRIGGLPVMDEEGRVTGMVTESDLFRVFVKIFELVDHA
jgi:CBS domain-containing protein